MKHTSSYLVNLKETDPKISTQLLGGKGANLIALSTIEHILVPEGFCITTEAYVDLIANNELVKILLNQLSHLKADERNKIAEICPKIRKTIEEIELPKRLEEEIVQELVKLGERNAYAVRSSATAEDLPSASFAGQQDSYLNIIGTDSILKHISKCWASLYTERAVVYRIQNGFDHQKVTLSVIIQKMIFPDAAGILFTADPLNSNRKIVSIDAGFGLGEAMVSGLVNADGYKVYDRKIIDKKIATKKIAIYALKEGGTRQQELSLQQQNQQVLKDEHILQLEQLGRKIEKKFGMPQDIEWCLVDDTFYIVQSRPITTLFPIPEANDLENHVYVSVGHNQMMTDAMKPLGLSFFLLTTRALMRIAGGRLFVDVTSQLSSSEGRNTLIENFGKYDPLISDALKTITDRGDFIKFSDKKNGSSIAPKPPLSNQSFSETDPNLVLNLIKETQASLKILTQTIQTKTGPALFDFILEDLSELKKLLFGSHTVIMDTMNAYNWINEKMYEWLGEKGAADILSQSVENNITSEMGLALLNVADTIRPYPDIFDYLKNNSNENFLNELTQFNGGKETKIAIDEFLHKYGMRCAGEIDITKTRWSDNPSILIPILLNNIKISQPGESKRKFEAGLQDALNKETDLLNRLAKLNDGEQKVKETKLMINRIRHFIGYREYPKYGMVSRYFIYKKALLKEAEQLLQANVIHAKEDIYFLNFEELRETVRTHQLDYTIIDKRKEEFKIFEKLTPPRVFTSDGEIISGKYKKGNLPDHAIAGLAVSSGIVEGRARVIMNIEEADLKDGDILVTAFTDPSWTPLFVSIKGLITEVGGLMTHGSVIAREYGLPAVVGVENATKLFQDGQRIRVNGTEGYIEIL